MVNKVMKKYFYGLDAFRAIAALLVILGHVELVKKGAGYPNIFDNRPFYMAHGSLAVTFFFVLMEICLQGITIRLNLDIARQLN